MSFAWFLAKRIHFAGGDDTQRVSPPAIRIAIAGIAIGLAVMLLSVAIVIGFKQEVRSKAASFGGHIQVLATTSNRTFEKQPICCSDSLLQAIRQLPGVQRAEPYITKPSVLKTDHDFLSVVVRSLPMGCDADHEPQGLTLSVAIARKLQLEPGQRARLYFVQGSESLFSMADEEASVKSRTLSIDSLYQTHFSEYDQQIVMAPAEMLRAVNQWDEDMASGIEIFIDDFDLLDQRYEAIGTAIGQLQDRRGTQLQVKHIYELNPQLFAWLDLLDTNVWVILGLMVAIAAFTMISGLLIIILERTGMIGLLKALGCPNVQLQRAFLYVAMRLTLRGLLWGNLVGIGLCLIQYYWHPFALDPDNYYLEWVPIHLEVWHVLILNIGTLLITLLILVAPSSFVARISPTQAMSQE